jgi:hypothetical protein
MQHYVEMLKKVIFLTLEVLLFLKILMTDQFLIPQLYMCRWGDRRGLNCFFFFNIGLHVLLKLIVALESTGLHMRGIYCPSFHCELHIS